MQRRTRCYSLISAALLLLFFFFLTTNDSAQLAPTRQPLRSTASPSTPTCFPPNPSSCEGDCAALLKIIRYEREKSTWNSYYGDVSAEVYRRGVGDGVFVEVGTAYGGLALHLLEALPQLRVIAVDPFLGAYDGADSMSQLFNDLPDKYGAGFPALWAQALAFEAGQKFGCRYALYNKKSEEGSRMIPPRSVDMVFIDGDHTQPAVERDIEAWRSRVKKGQVMLFNDYQDRWPGVKAAVDKFATETEQPVWYLPLKSWGNVGLYNLPKLFAKYEDDVVGEVAA
jgi:Methyltransferase domain